MTKEEKSWILYDVANSAFTLTIVTAIMPAFFKSYYANTLSDATSTAYWGYANSFGSLLVALCAPILGTIADYKDMKKRLFVTFLLVGLAGTFSLLLVQQGQWILALIIFIISIIGYSGSNIFYDSFLIDVTHSKNRDRISSFGYGLGYIGSVLPFVTCLLLIHFATTADSKTFMVKISFIITGLWWLLFSIPMLKNVKQKYYQKSSNRSLKRTFLKLWITLNSIKRYKNCFLFLLAYFFYIDGVDTIIRMAVPYGKDIGLNTSDLLIIILVIQIIAFPCAIAYGKLASLFSAKKMIFTGVFTYIIITIIAFCIPLFETQSTKLGLFWSLAILVAASQGGIQALSRSFFSRLIPAKKSAEFFGFYNIFGKFATILGPALMAFTTMLTKRSQTGILSIILLFIVGAIILAFVKEESF